MSYEGVDMNFLELGGSASLQRASFDFLWSTCSVEHVGSVSLGKRRVAALGGGWERPDACLPACQPACLLCVLAYVQELYLWRVRSRWPALPLCAQRSARGFSCCQRPACFDPACLEAESPVGLKAATSKERPKAWAHAHELTPRMSSPPLQVCHERHGAAQAGRAGGAHL